MKIIVYRHVYDDKIYRIEPRSRYSSKTDAEIEEAVQKANNEDRKCSLVEISGELEEMFNFMLGGAEYKKCSDIQDLINELKCVQDRFESIESDLGALEDSLEFCKKEVEQLKN